MIEARIKTVRKKKFESKDYFENWSKFQIDQPIRKSRF